MFGFKMYLNQVNLGERVIYISHDYDGIRFIVLDADKIDGFSQYGSLMINVTKCEVQAYSAGVAVIKPSASLRTLAFIVSDHDARNFRIQELSAGGHNMINVRRPFGNDDEVAYLITFYNDAVPFYISYTCARHTEDMGNRGVILIDADYRPYLFKDLSRQVIEDIANSV